jgi:hypothetical protein
MLPRRGVSALRDALVRRLERCGARAAHPAADKHNGARRALLFNVPLAQFALLTATELHLLSRPVSSWRPWPVFSGHARSQLLHVRTSRSERPLRFLTLLLPSRLPAADDDAAADASALPVGLGQRVIRARPGESPTLRVLFVVDETQPRGLCFVRGRPQLAPPLFTDAEERDGEEEDETESQEEAEGAEARHLPQRPQHQQEALVAAAAAPHSANASPHASTATPSSASRRRARELDPAEQFPPAKLLRRPLPAAPPVSVAFAPRGASLEPCEVPSHSGSAMTDDAALAAPASRPAAAAVGKWAAGEEEAAAGAMARRVTPAMQRLFSMNSEEVFEWGRQVMGERVAAALREHQLDGAFLFKCSAVGDALPQLLRAASSATFEALPPPRPAPAPAPAPNAALSPRQ